MSGHRSASSKRAASGLSGDHPDEVPTREALGIVTAIFPPIAVIYSSRTVAQIGNAGTSVQHRSIHAADRLRFAKSNRYLIGF